MRVRMATQIIGVMSTPPNGGTIWRKGSNKGSVGHAIRLKGIRFRFTCGYQVKTIRKMKAMVVSPRTGPRIWLAMLANMDL